MSERRLDPVDEDALIHDQGFADVVLLGAFGAGETHVLGERGEHVVERDDRRAPAFRRCGEKILVGVISLRKARRFGGFLHADEMFRQAPRIGILEASEEGLVARRDDLAPHGLAIEESVCGPVSHRVAPSALKLFGDLDVESVGGAH